MKTNLLLVCLLLLPLRLFSAPGDYVVMSVKGKVEYKKNGKGQFLALTVGAQLTPKDIVKTSFTSYAKVMFKQKQLLTIDENTTIQIQALASQSAGERSEKESAAGKIMAYVVDRMTKSGSKNKAQNYLGGVRAGDEMFNAAFPRKGFILTTQPVFEWINTGDKSNYTFKLLDENLSAVVERKIDTTKFYYSAEQPKLQDGKRYIWNVIRQTDGRESDYVTFSILPRDTAEMVQKELASLAEELKKMNADEIIIHIIKGTYFEQKDLLYDAFMEYRDAVKLAPDILEYREMANAVLYKMGLYNEERALLH